MIFFLHIKVTSCWHQRHLRYLKEVRNEHHFRKGSIFVILHFSNYFLVYKIIQTHKLVCISKYAKSTLKIYFINEVLIYFCRFYLVARIYYDTFSQYCVSNYKLCACSFSMNKLISYFILTL